MGADPFRRAAGARLEGEAARGQADPDRRRPAARRAPPRWSRFRRRAKRPRRSAKGLYSVALEPRYRFENFVVGKANEVAFSAAQTLATADKVAFNPLFIHGGTGRGKTHLLHAIGHEFHRQRPRAKIIYMSAEKFTVEFLAALRANETFKFKQQLRSADLLMIDDVQFIAGKESTQEEFFHTMNEIISAGRRFVISSDRAPQDLDGLEPRILSRLSWGLVADINAADLELRLNIITKKLEPLPDVMVPDDVVMFLAKRISSNVRELEGALNRIAAYAAMQNRAIDLDFVGEVLANILRANQRRISIDEIQTRVSDHYRIRKAEMTSARRAREVARPRQVAMYLSKQLTPRSLPEIGRRFGGRDHTTVIHAVTPDRETARPGRRAGRRHPPADAPARELSAALRARKQGRSPGRLPSSCGRSARCCLALAASP